MKPLLSILALLIFYCNAPCQTTWKKYTNAQGAFSVEFPGEPKISETTSTSPEGYTVKVKVHMYQEGSNVCYVLYNEMEAGINIMNDSLYLNSVTDQMIERLGHDATVKENIRFENVPGQHFTIEFTDGVAEGKILLRTNRAYFIVSFLPQARQADRTRFLNSFHLLPYQKMALSPYQSPDHYFKINFPAKPKISVEENNGSTLHAYYALDPYSGNNYSVAVDKFSPYIQYKSDSAVLAGRVLGYTIGGDSIISIKDVIVDGRPAKDLVIHKGDNNFKLRVRVFTNGNYSYTIFTFLPYSEITATEVNQFFDSFRFTAKVPGNLLSDKSDLLLKDIESTDTTILKEVLPAIENYAFQEKHLSRIHELLMKKFDDDADTLASRKLTLLESLAEMKSPTSVSFIQKLFPTLQSNAELEFRALDVLVKLNSPQANDLIVELLSLHKGVKGNIWKYSGVFSYSRLDSTYARDFFFKVIPLIVRPFYKTGLYSLAQQMLRNKKVTFEELTSVRKIFSNDFNSQFENYKRDTIYQFLDDLSIILAYDKVSKGELEIFKKLSADQNEYLAMHANTSLLRLHQKANDKKIESLAKDRYFRKDLFKEFKDFKLETLFPRPYYRQDSIAVSELFSYVSDEYVTPAAMKVVHSELVDFHGHEKRFFVIEFMDPEDEVTYRGVAGPYSSESIDVFADLTGSFFEEDREDTHHNYLMDYIARFEQ